MTGNTGGVVLVHSVKSTPTCLIFCAIYPIIRASGSLWRVLGILHQTDVVAASSSMLVPTPRCDAVVDVFSPIHCWAGSPSPADVTYPTAGCGRCRWQGSGCGSGCVCSG